MRIWKKKLPQNLKEVDDLYQAAELVGDAVRAVYQHVVGKVRYTVSSVGRLQVKLSAANPQRYLVACNQRRTPLHAVAKKDQLSLEFASRLGILPKLFILHC